MHLMDAINHIIDDGIEGARHDYIKPRDKSKLDGSIKGFEDCRGKNPSEIEALLLQANQVSQRAFIDANEGRISSEQYWFWRCRTIEIEWVANVLSHIMVAQGWPPIGIMTANGGLQAARIISVAP